MCPLLAPREQTTEQAKATLVRKGSLLTSTPLVGDMLTPHCSHLENLAVGITGKGLGGLQSITIIKLSQWQTKRQTLLIGLSVVLTSNLEQTDHKLIK